MTGGGMQPHPEALYYHIAADALESARPDANEFSRKQAVATAMVFSALCLEAFINQQYDWSGSRISLKKKWLKLPLNLGFSKTFSEGEEPFRTFSHLVRTRNERLVHFQPSGETQTLGNKSQRRYFGDLVDDVGLAAAYVTCVTDMIGELSRLTNGRTDAPAFLKGDRYLSHIWSSVTVPYESR